MSPRSLALVVVFAAVGLTSCVRPKTPLLQTTVVPEVRLWQAPADVSGRDLYDGPWGSTHAPDPNGLYTFVEHKHSGVNRGMTVVDAQGREWSVKQAFSSGLDDEGPVEVVLSRLLSAIGYYQPPVYYLPKFTLKDDWGIHREPGGRFRLKHETLENAGSWQWDHNPFVGTAPYEGLLVLLMMFNCTDLKMNNNTLYKRQHGGRVEWWYVVRDLGAALGDTRRIAPRKNRARAFEQHPFMLGVRNGYVEFANDGWYRRLVRERITPTHVVWASNLLAGLSDRQWRDAFRAGGYDPQVAAQFIRTLRTRIRQGQALLPVAGAA